MKNSKRMAYAVAGISALAVVGALGTLGVSQALAATEDGEYPLIIQNLAEKFNVSEEEVHAVFETTHEEQRETRLNEAVEAGTITEAQKTAITEMQDKMHAKIEAIRTNDDLSDDEKREQIQALHEEFRDWAEDNDIDMREIGPGPRGGRGMGMNEDMGRGRGMF